MRRTEAPNSSPDRCRTPTQSADKSRENHHRLARGRGEPVGRRCRIDSITCNAELTEHNAQTNDIHREGTKHHQAKKKRKSTTMFVIIKKRALRLACCFSV